MIKEYSQNRSNVILNFSVKYCDTPKELLSSLGFRKVLEKYITVLEKKDALLLERLNQIVQEDFSTTIIKFFRLLIVLDTSEIRKLNNEYAKLLRSSSDIIEFVEGFYNYWRGLERYALIQSRGASSGIENVNFIEANNNFSNLVLKTYRLIEENILGYNHNVYRQLTAGVNAGVVLFEGSTRLPADYDYLKNISFVKSIILAPPFVIYPKKNTRSGYFEEVYTNPIENLSLNESHYFCYPAKVGNSLAFIYFHRDFMNHGVSLCNLFELAKYEEFEFKKPDLVYVFGARIENNEKKTVFYCDKKNNMYVGLVSNNEEVDYFGYMKKMILTLHNIRMIESNSLPIHGAMVNITLKNGKKANIAIVGDSGAGKSESLEAFKKLSDKYLKEMKIIFDDMGTFRIENNKVYAYGTEIGAFVRLDDFETGFAFKEMDRAIFMNPNRINARLLYPVSTYNDIIRGYKVDMLLYANNYENSKQELKIFENIDEAKSVFVKGLRKAKGTTSEKGLVESYFANPFGPHQRKEETDIIIDNVFEQLFSNNIIVGEIYTKLAIKGHEHLGPEKAAKKLFEWIINT
ncbi:MAG: phosphoenolpyruvate carboxykinase [Firmicutes bacterium]|nr:phosphoenolpyruvate carboxykinase [Bacillota bacterium]